MALKVSIITAVYNNSATIEDAIVSVASQTYKPIEHIIIDGGSGVETISVINKYRNNLALVVSEPDKGIYDALNKGLTRATGDIIGLLHSDDIFGSNTVIEQIVNVFSNEHPDGVYGNLVYVDKNKTDKIIRYWQSNNFDINSLKKGWMPPHPTLFLKKELISKTGFYSLNYRIAADYDFMLRVLTTPQTKFQYIPTVITKMRLGGASNRNLKNIVIKMWEDYKILKKNRVGGLWALMLKNILKVGQFFKSHTSK
jgi:glycosyltransferase